MMQSEALRITFQLPEPGPAGLVPKLLCWGCQERQRGERESLIKSWMESIERELRARLEGGQTILGMRPLSK